MSIRGTLKYGSMPMGTKPITQNGEADVSAYAKVNVNVSPEVELEDKTITANGTYTASAEYDGLGTVVVNVPQPVHTLQNKTVTANGSVAADEGYYGLGTVTVNVDIPEYPSVPSTEAESIIKVGNNFYLWRTV